jgi:glycerol-3-phosphate acyltransferase PlsY
VAKVFRSGDESIGVLAFILDVSEDAVATRLSYYKLGIQGIPMDFITIAPILGHILSPFQVFLVEKRLVSHWG